MPTIIDHAGAQTKANPNSPSHSPAPTLTAQAMHGDDEHNPALHSTFDPALFDQLVYACVKRVPRGCVTTYGKSAASHNFSSIRSRGAAHNTLFLPRHFPQFQDTSPASATTPSMLDRWGRPCGASP
jgi:O6-methylguanine-DNA--protein-cysteine methyltransferase